MCASHVSYPFIYLMEGNVLFHDALNTFYLRLYGVKHMVKDHSDSLRENPLLPHGLLFPVSSKGSFICIFTDKIAHTTVFVTPVIEHWFEREIAQWVHSAHEHQLFFVYMYKHTHICIHKYIH